MENYRVNHKLKVLYDVTILSSGLQENGNRGGIFFVALNILRELIKREDIQVNLYCQDFYKEAVREYIRLNPIHYLPSPIYYYEGDLKKIDVFLSPVFQVPNEIEMIESIQKYIILHDTIPILYPEYYPDMKGSYWLKDLITSMNCCDRYFTISNNTKKDFLQLRQDLKESQFVTTYLSADEFFCDESQIELKKTVFEKYKLPLNKKYVLALNSTEPRKNVIRIVNSFLKFIKKNQINDLILILTGFFKENNVELQSLCKDGKLIYLTGYIEDEERKVFYSNAEWFIYTSQYEGFGMPPLEAMECGCPVIVSNNSSLPEVVANAGILVDWDSEEKHIDAYENYYYRKEYRDEMSTIGRKRAKKFSWTCTVDKMVNKMSENKRLNIAFDATAIFGPMSKNRGIGNYAKGLFTTLINQDKSNNYFLLNVFEDTKLKCYSEDDSHFHECYIYCGKDNQLLNDKDFENVLGSLVKRFLYEKEIDLFIITSPFENAILPYNIEWFKGVKTVGIVYDIIPYLFQEKYFGDIKQNGQWYLERMEILKKLDLCLTISDSAKDDMVAHAGFEQEKIKTIWGAVDKKFKVVHSNADIQDAVLNKYKITDDFILCTGGDDDRKNIAFLIQAYAQMPQRLIEKYQLVIVCKMSRKSIERYQKIIQEKSVFERVILTGFIPDEELVLLYNIAFLVAFPSLYEGFGLPIVEAFACDTPVLTSNNSSLIQVAGDAAIVVDPYSVENISRGLTEALCNVDLQELVAKGRERVKLFQWETVAKATLMAISNLPCSRTKKTIAKIAMFTPMPPQQSGIADYSFDIICEISQYMDIDVYIDKGYLVDCQLPENVVCFEFDKFELNANQYQEIIYQVGNSVFHRYMWKYIQKYPGIVVLHDGNMHPVVYHVAKNENNPKLYENILREDYNEKTVKNYIKGVWREKLVPALDTSWVNGFIVNHAKKIIVHNLFLQENLLRKNLQLDISYIPLYAKIRIDETFKVDRETLGFTKENIIVGIFGMTSRTKKIQESLEAFYKLSQKEPRLRLVIVGEKTPDYVKKCECYIQKNNLHEKVIFTGYVPADLMQIYINICDMCLNLRSVYKGESSATLAHIMAQGKSVIVNNIGAFSEIPDDACVKIPYRSIQKDDKEIDEIANAIEKLLDADERKKIGENARRYVDKELSIEKIGKEYYECIIRPSYPSLPKAAIDKLLIDEIKKKQYSSDEIDALTNTIVYAKGF